MSLIYRLFMIVNNSLWYYFAPFVFSHIAFFYMLKQKHTILEAAEAAEAEGDWF